VSTPLKLHAHAKPACQPRTVLKLSGRIGRNSRWRPAGAWIFTDYTGGHQLPAPCSGIVKVQASYYAHPNSEGMEQSSKQPSIDSAQRMAKRTTVTLTFVCWYAPLSQHRVNQLFGAPHKKVGSPDLWDRDGVVL